MQLITSALIKNKFLIFIGLISLFLSSCTIYKSSDRSEFDKDSPTFRIQSVQVLSCSDETVAHHAQNEKFLTYLEETKEFLWMFQVNEKIIFESTNTEGTYCLYEVHFE